MLTYLDVHLMYTLPVIGALALISWPFLTRSEIFKIALICGISIVYTTPWDNYVVWKGGWTYPEDRVLAFIGYVPVEEYMFFVIQSTMTSLWALLCVRWSTPCLNFNYDRSTYLLIRWIPIAGFGVLAVVGYEIAVPGHHTFYTGCVLWWMCPVLMFMWYGGGNFFVKKIVSATAAVILPSLYLCWVDQLALKNNVWHINKLTSYNVFVAEDLPYEEAFFFFVVNFTIVLAGACFDKARGIMETYTSEYPLRFAINGPYINQMLRAFIVSEYLMPSVVTEDIQKSINVLNVASKSFTTASFLFQAGIRLDLIILYAFCRVTDDMIDNEPDINKKKIKLQLTEKFINELFADRKSDYDVKKKSHTVNINWAQYETKLTDVEMSSFRALTRIAFYLPRKPFYELLAGYQWDIDGRLFRNEADLMEYCNYVAGSVGVLCVYIMMYRCDDDKFDLLESYDYVIDKAQQMGRVLQLVNIARDIVTDSKTLGRCYIPTEYMDDKQEEIRILCDEKNPRSLGDKKLKKYSKRMIQLADQYQSESVDAIKCLPNEVRGSVLAATEIYRGNISAIKTSPTYPTRAALPRLHKIFLGLYSLYIKSNRFIL